MKRFTTMLCGFSFARLGTPFVAFGLLLSASALVTLPAASAQDGGAGGDGISSPFTLAWWSTDCGAALESDFLTLHGTIESGGASLGTTSMSGGGAFTLTGGFVAGFLASAPSCPGDFDNDGVVGGADLGQLLALWGPCGQQYCDEDLDGDGAIDGSDLGELLARWGECGGE